MSFFSFSFSLFILVTRIHLRNLNNDAPLKAPTTPPFLFTDLFWSSWSMPICSFPSFFSFFLFFPEAEGEEKVSGKDFFEKKGEKKDSTSPPEKSTRHIRTQGRRKKNKLSLLTWMYSVGLERPSGSKPRSPGSEPSSHAGLSTLGSQSASPPPREGDRLGAAFLAGAATLAFFLKTLAATSRLAAPVRRASVEVCIVAGRRGGGC